MFLPLDKKLHIIYSKFESELNRNLEFTIHEKNLLKIILKFLYDINISNHEFWNLTPKHQENFKKFIADRFFKHEAGKSGDYRGMYHDVSVHSDNLSTFSTNSQTKSRSSANSGLVRIESDGKKNSLKNNINNRVSNPQYKVGEVPSFFPLATIYQEKPVFKSSEPEPDDSLIRVKSFQPGPRFLNVPKKKKISKKNLRRRSQGSIKLRIRATKPGILKYVNQDFFVDSLIPCRPKGKNANNDNLQFKIARFSTADLFHPDMEITLLQDYLRKRERLNLICKRKKKMHAKTKRNDEKTKKIFKKTMKKLFQNFKKTSSAIE